MKVKPSVLTHKKFRGTLFFFTLSNFRYYLCISTNYKHKYLLTTSSAKSFLVLNWRPRHNKPMEVLTRSVFWFTQGR